ncbi:MAG: hypothetical protein ACTSPB_18360 [Candidatus Thorarchaeota archaeon]
MEHRQSKPKRIKENYALDFYQMWCGNDRGQELFDTGNTVSMPGEPSFVMHGKEITESVWFKLILQGKAEDGYVDLSGDPRQMIRSWNNL